MTERRGPPGTMSRKEAAKALGVGPHALLTMIEMGQILETKLGHRFYVSEASVRAAQARAQGQERAA